MGSKGHFYLKVVMLNIKLTGMEHRTPYKQMFCPFTHPHPWVGQKVKKSKTYNNIQLHASEYFALRSFFSKGGRVEYQIKRKEVQIIMQVK